MEPLSPMSRSTKPSTADTGRLFLDTSGIYALLVRQDERHERAREILQAAAQHRRLLVTSDYVLDETITLLRARGHGHLVRPLLDMLKASQALRLEWMNGERFAGALAVLQRQGVPAVSFTDCFSFLLMRELELTEALSSDVHFRAAGFMPLLA